MGFGSMLRDYLQYYHISQTDFAMRLGISKKHVNEIINGNTCISLELMHAISLITDIDVNLIFYAENKRIMKEYLEQHFSDAREIKKFLNEFYLKEMNELNWIRLKDKESLVQNSLDLLEFLNVKSFDLIPDYINQKILYKKKDDANINKIFLWIKHCDKLILEQKVREYHSDALSSLLEELRVLRNQKFNVTKLIQVFNRYGIYLVIEDAIKGTKIRGAMMVKGDHPAIYITKYYKEKASFYFTLYHELGHIKGDYNRAKNKILVLDEDGSSEDQCDVFALNQMIDTATWNEILNHYDRKESICKSKQIPLCFLYSRLAREGIISYSSNEYHSHKEII